MKNIILFLTLSFLVSCKPKNEQLYKHTDYFVESLQTTYSSYGLIGGIEYQKVTEDNMYQITPIGRLVNVKIMAEVPLSDYQNLEKELEVHYEGDVRVKDVYICAAGTVMIDCRN